MSVGLGLCPECGLTGKHTIACREPHRRLLRACAEDSQAIGTLSAASRCAIRGELGVGCMHGKSKRPKPAQAPAKGLARRPTPGGPFVVNRHHYRDKPMPQPWVYIGRNDRHPERASPLRNPFDVRRYGIKDALRLYREHLLRCIADKDPDVMAALESITAAHHLVCSCAPKPCHGDVVAEVWREMFGGR